MTQTYRICLLPGDGIGPEIIAEGVKVLDAVGAKHGAAFAYTEALIGGCAIDATGAALPDETLDVAKASDAVLLAAVGGPKWDTTDPAKPRPEQGLARHPQGARPVHEPAPRADILRARGRLHVEARDRGRRGPDDRPRA